VASKQQGLGWLTKFARNVMGDISKRRKFTESPSYKEPRHKKPPKEESTFRKVSGPSMRHHRTKGKYDPFKRQLRNRMLVIPKNDRPNTVSGTHKR
jgi:hypothetical protein